MKTSIYFMALLPPRKIQDEVTTFKQLAARRFNTKRALTSPPHITVVTPFRLEEEGVRRVIQEARYIAGRQTSFPIELKDFNCFAPRVIYMDTVDSDILTAFRQLLNQHLEKVCGIEFKYRNQDFIPHMTIAFKDLKKEEFFKAWEYFRKAKYNQAFEANQLTLLEHDGKEWQILEVLDFAKKDLRDGE